MKKTPTLLMKELKFLQSEAERLHLEDTERSFAPLNEKMEFRYDTGYSYEKNREEMNKIYEQELRIRSALAKFNSTTKIDGLDLTVAEALVRISQLQKEIKILTVLANRKEYTETSVGGYISNKTVINKINYDQNKAIADLKKLQQELSRIQIAVDELQNVVILKLGACNELGILQIDLILLIVRIIRKFGIAGHSQFPVLAGIVGHT